MFREDNDRAELNVEGLFAAYGSALYRFALHSTGNREDARDVVQEVFLRVQLSRNTFRGESQIKTWLFQIARNYITDGLRRKRHHTKIVDSMEPLCDDFRDKLESTFDLRRAIKLLRLEFRQVIALRYIEDLSMKETAKILNWTLGKVRTTQYRALQRLRQVLNESSNTPSEGATIDEK